ncbi:hypothetical protein SUNI508_10601 [Seiridium unicorne]|uniref:Uncharacterized protein n=1 Tax=Seiridium unicorne TaxID=138068 RepID=A0ABR2UKM1_9PEZI
MPVQITFESIEAWDSTREKIDEIIEKDTGNKNYVSTRSLPPIIFGLNLKQTAVDELKKLEGVNVRSHDDE